MAYIDARAGWHFEEASIAGLLLASLAWPVFVILVTFRWLARVMP